MKIPAFKIFIITLVLAIMGIFLLPRLPVQLNPSPTAASITVSYNWPNASPFNTEQQVTSVLEGGFSTLRSLETINSRSSKGYGRIELVFNKNRSLDMARFEVASVIRQLYKNLPQQVTYPVISVNKPNEEDEQAFLSYRVTAPHSPFDIQKTVKNQLEPALGAINGIDKIQIFGANPQEWVVSYQEGNLQSLSISREEFFVALQNYFERKSLGEVYYKNQLLTLNILPNSNSIDWDIPIKKVSGRMVKLSDIASVKQQEQESTRYYRVNGFNAITLVAFAEKGVNTLTLAKNFDAELKSVQNQLPPNYTIFQTYNATEYVKEELSKIYKRSIYTILILLLFVLLVSRSFAYLLITVLCIAANLSIAFLLYYFFQVEIQLYSIAGITISLGLIIDNSIVMIDNIRTQGNTKIFIPILASTLTTIGALSIIYFMDENYKSNLIDFAWVIIINLFVSLSIALFLIPALLEKIPLRRRPSTHLLKKISNDFFKIYASFIKLSIKHKKIGITIIIIIFGIPFFMLPQKMDRNETFFEKSYNATLGNDWYRENIRPYKDKYLGGTLRLFAYYVFESAFYGKNEETKLHVIASMEKGATVHQMNEAYLQIENYLHQFPEIKQFSTNIYSGSYASMEISFKKPYDEGSFPYTIKSRLIRKALDLGGMDWNIYGVGNGYNSGGGQNEPVNFRIEARGYNYNELNVWADTLKQKLSAHPRVRNVNIKENNSREIKRSFEYVLELDKERLAILDAPPRKVYRDLRTLSLSKFTDITLNINGKFSDLRFESEESENFDIWQVQNSMLGTKKNPYNLRETSTVSKVLEEENIYKENQEYIRLVEFQYTGAEKKGGEFLDRILKNLENQLPLGFSFEKTDIYGKFDLNKNNNYPYLLLLILLIIYTVCAVLFESFKQPFIILSVIPISFIGVFLTFYLLNFNFDQGGIASFVLLSGLTVNASIFIVNGFNSLLKTNPNEEPIILYIEAFKQKIFPILLTIISTILGFIPFVVGGQKEVFWFALGVGTMGGLVFSLIGILLYLPLFSIKKRDILNAKNVREEA